VGDGKAAAAPRRLAVLAEGVVGGHPSEQAAALVDDARRAHAGMLHQPQRVVDLRIGLDGHHRRPVEVGHHRDSRGLQRYGLRLPPLGAGQDDAARRPRRYAFRQLVHEAPARRGARAKPLSS
jgi:hypothetical protein